MRRGMLAALVALLIAGSVSAQDAPWRLVQGPDGVLFVIRGDIKHRIVPAVMTDADMAIPEGEAWEGGTVTVASAPPAAPAPASLSSGKKISDTTVLTAPSGLRLAITVNAFEDGATTTQRNRVPSGRWAVVDWTVKNEGSTDASISRLDFKIQTTDGYLIERAVLGIRQPDLDTDRLGSGQIVRGWLSYDVPAGQVLKSIIYQPTGGRQFVVVEL